MNIKKLQTLVRLSGKTKTQLASECGVARITIDNTLAGADVKISTVEALANVLGVSVGELFDDRPALSVIQNGGQNTVTGDTVRNADPSALIGMVMERDRQVNRLIEILAASLGKSSAREYDGGATACQPDLNGGR